MRFVIPISVASRETRQGSSQTLPRTLIPVPGLAQFPQVPLIQHTPYAGARLAHPVDSGALDSPRHCIRVCSSVLLVLGLFSPFIRLIGKYRSFIAIFFTLPSSLPNALLRCQLCLALVKKRCDSAFASKKVLTSVVTVATLLRWAPSALMGSPALFARFYVFHIYLGDNSHGSELTGWPCR